MNPEGARRGLFNRGIELQQAINDLAAEYFAEMRRQEAQKERFAQLAEMLRELRKVRALAAASGAALPEVLTADADAVHDVIERAGIFTGETTPPADCSAN